MQLLTIKNVNLYFKKKKPKNAFKKKSLFLIYRFRHTISVLFFNGFNFGTSFNSIEFPKRMLYRAYFENSIFGKMSDLTLVVKTRRGIAEYPSVSLSAVPLSDRKMLQERLLQILGV